MTKRRLPPRFGWIAAAFLFGFILLLMAMIVLIVDPGSRGELLDSPSGSRHNILIILNAPPHSIDIETKDNDVRTPQLKRTPENGELNWIAINLDKRLFYRSSVLDT